MRTFLPHAHRIWLQTAAGWEELKRIHAHGLFVWNGKTKPPTPCKLRIEQDGHTFERHDLYSFTSLISAHDLHLFGEGRLLQAYQMLGARVSDNGWVSWVEMPWV